MLSVVSPLAVLALALSASAAETLRFVTYNLRYDSRPNNVSVAESLAALPDPLAPVDYYAQSGEQPWSLRRHYITERVLSEGAVVFSLQEGLVRQINDLTELLGSGWDYVGVGRNDGKTAGEYAAIFYRKDTVTLRSVDYFWLSNTPFEPSRYPGAGSIRICTAAKFQTRGGTAFTLLNTHLDEQSDDQRRLAGSMMLMRARYEAAKSGEPVLITGDFNSPPIGTDSGAYEIVTGQIPPIAVNETFAAKFAVNDDQLPDFKLLDIRAEAPRDQVGRNYATYTAWGKPTDTSAWTRIDFVFGGSNGGWKAGQYKVETSLTDDGVLASDHRPVFADVTL
ncbi:DNase I-like protein [Auricularia subglabra TFB-10046 SS5]|nr:DNase I-like protein [Auricularia subglabra TFB-10046 SS5]